MTLDNIEATVLGCATGIDGWTTIQRPMSLAVRLLSNRGLVDTQNDQAPLSIEYRLTDAGRTAILAQSDFN